MLRFQTVFLILLSLFLFSCGKGGSGNETDNQLTLEAVNDKIELIWANKVKLNFLDNDSFEGSVEVSFIDEPIYGDIIVEENKYFAVTCENCKYTEFYKGSSSTAGNVFDFFTG